MSFFLISLFCPFIKLNFLGLITRNELYMSEKLTQQLVLWICRIVEFGTLDLHRSRTPSRSTVDPENIIGEEHSYLLSHTLKNESLESESLEIPFEQKRQVLS